MFVSTAFSSITWVSHFRYLPAIYDSFVPFAIHIRSPIWKKKVSDLSSPVLTFQCRYSLCPTLLYLCFSLNFSWEFGRPLQKTFWSTCLPNSFPLLLLSVQFRVPHVFVFLALQCSNFGLKILSKTPLHVHPFLWWRLRYKPFHWQSITLSLVNSKVKVSARVLCVTPL